MKILNDKITQNLIHEVQKGVLTSLNFVLSKYENSNLFAYVLYIDDYCQCLGWAANTISYYEKLKENFRLKNILLLNGATQNLK